MSTVLSWETHHPDRAAWTAHTLSTVRAHLSDLDGARDMATFAPKYGSATDDQKVVIWGELICGVALHESSWNPCARSLEPGGKKDELTKEPLYCDGLLQLSYQDTVSYPHLNLPFDWERDKQLARDDCSKTIVDPIKNLTGGIAIMAHQVRNQKAIVLEAPYWSTLGDPKKWNNSKVAEIAAMVRKLPFAS